MLKEGGQDNLVGRKPLATYQGSSGEALFRQLHFGYIYPKPQISLLRTHHHKHTFDFLKGSIHAS